MKYHLTQNWIEDGRQCSQCLECRNKTELKATIKYILENNETITGLETRNLKNGTSKQLDYKKYV